MSLNIDLTQKKNNKIQTIFLTKNFFNSDSTIIFSVWSILNKSIKKICKSIPNDYIKNLNMDCLIYKVRNTKIIKINNNLI